MQRLGHLDANKAQFKKRYELEILDDNFGAVPGRPGEFYLTDKVRKECKRDTATANMLQVSK